MALKLLMFDVFSTVVDWRTGVTRSIAAAYAAKGHDVDASAIADAWRAEYEPAMERVRAGARGYVRLDVLHHENLRRVLDARGESGLFTETERAAINRAWEDLPPWSDAPAGLARLKARHLIAPCSNGSIRIMTQLARAAALPWDCILGADIARAYKPDPAAYLRSLAALDLAPAEAMMVAAHNDDLEAARACGLATAYVQRPDEFGAENRHLIPPASDWDVVAEDFNALAAALGA